MTTTPIALRIQQSNLALPILVGGAVAGTFDLIAAFISFGPGSPRAIAGGLLGRLSFSRWSGHLHPRPLYSLLHRLLRRRRLLPRQQEARLPDQHFFVCGLFFGIAYLSRDAPGCAAALRLSRHGTIQYRGLVQGLLRTCSSLGCRSHSSCANCLSESRFARNGYAITHGSLTPARSPAHRAPSPSRHVSQAALPAPRRRARETPLRPAPAAHLLRDKP